MFPANVQHKSAASESSGEGGWGRALYKSSRTRRLSTSCVVRFSSSMWREFLLPSLVAQRFDWVEAGGEVGGNEGGE
jgi:hypothetical protein